MSANDKQHRAILQRIAGVGEPIEKIAELLAVSKVRDEFSE